MLPYEGAGGQLEDTAPVDIGIELPVKAVERLHVDEPGGFEGAGGFTIGAQDEFVLYEQFKELFVAELGGRRRIDKAVPALVVESQTALAGHVQNQLGLLLVMVILAFQDFIATDVVEHGDIVVFTDI